VFPDFGGALGVMGMDGLGKRAFGLDCISDDTTHRGFCILGEQDGIGLDIMNPTTAANDFFGFVIYCLAYVFEPFP
jgi:hypothetical protein